MLSPLGYDEAQRLKYAFCRELNRRMPYLWKYVVHGSWVADDCVKVIVQTRLGTIKSFKVTTTEIETIRSNIQIQKLVISLLADHIGEESATKRRCVITTPSA